MRGVFCHHRSSLISCPQTVHLGGSIDSIVEAFCCADVLKGVMRFEGDTKFTAYRCQFVVLRLEALRHDFVLSDERRYIQLGPHEVAAEVVIAHAVEEFSKELVVEVDVVACNDELVIAIVTVDVLIQDAFQFEEAHINLGEHHEVFAAAGVYLKGFGGDDCPSMGAEVDFAFVDFFTVDFDDVGKLDKGTYLWISAGGFTVKPEYFTHSP